MDSDKIIVLDEGRVLEYEKPKILLSKDKGAFKSLVDESSDKEELYALCNKQPNPKHRHNAQRQLEAYDHLAVTRGVVEYRAVP